VCVSCFLEVAYVSAGAKRATAVYKGPGGDGSQRHGTASERAAKVVSVFSSPTDGNRQIYLSKA
jgi:hypothetical protein